MIPPRSHRDTYDAGKCRFWALWANVIGVLINGWPSIPTRLGPNEAVPWFCAYTIGENGPAVDENAGQVGPKRPEAALFHISDVTAG